MKLARDLVKKYTHRYYKALEKFKYQQAYNESTTEQAFKDLLHNIALDLDLTLVKTSESVAKKGKIIPDGIIKDDYFRVIGYWEAKDTSDDLDEEIYKKLKKGYPRSNTIFEDTEYAVLYQDNSEHGRYNLKNENELIELLLIFFNYNEPIYEQFRIAVQKFKENISHLAADFKTIILEAKQKSEEFTIALNNFLEVCKSSFHNDIKIEEIEDMLIQHLLTERIFRKVFDNPEFIQKNVIAAQLEKLVDVLTKKSFNKAKFFKAIDPYYIAIEEEAAKFDDLSEKQAFLNKIYEAFFQSYSVKNADKNGIVYTPQSIVRFMVKFTNSLLQNEFGKSLSSQGVNIIDPCTGTGNFVMEILRNIDPALLHHKYKNELFCNEIMLLPYYIASANIEQYYFDTIGTYEPFENIVFTDTLELIEDPARNQAQQQLDFFFNEVNSARAKHELSKDLFVIIGNPPYNASQENENQNNKNTKNPIVDKRIAETYAFSSNAQLKNKLYDPYVKFFRWASDRLDKHNGIICFISNNSFMSDIQFDGMREHLLNEFHHVYHFDLGGDVYLNPKLSGSKHNVFGIKVGVGITFLIRNSEYTEHKIFYHNLDEYITRWDKEDVIDEYTKENTELSELDWSEGVINESNNFVFDKASVEISKEYDKFIELYSENLDNDEFIFKAKYPGINTARNEWVYGYTKYDIEPKMTLTIDFFNEEVERLEKYILENKIVKFSNNIIDNFVRIDDEKLKWSDGLKNKLKSLKKAKYDENKCESSLFRPFLKRTLYFDKTFVDRPSLFHLLKQTNNSFLLLNGLGSKKVSTLITNDLPNFDTIEKTQVFPLINVYLNKQKETCTESNITAWALKYFKTETGISEITPQQVFYYVYGINHHKTFRSRYDQFLKTSSPRVPFLKQHFAEISEIGRQLAEIHINYQQADEYKIKPSKETLKLLNAKRAKVNYNITHMKISGTVLTYNKYLEFFVPPQVFEYKVNGRSPLEWIVDQYKDYETDNDEILKLISKVITVSLNSVELINQLDKYKLI